MDSYDAHLFLLRVKWDTENWRIHYETLHQIKWEEIRQSTLDIVAYGHDKFDKERDRTEGLPPGVNLDNIGPSPAVMEHTRRRIEELSLKQSASPAITENESVLAWVSPITTVRNKKVETAPPPKPVPAGLKVPNWIYKDDKPGLYTVGFELELPIAVNRTGGLFAEIPHPSDLRWEAEEIISDDYNSAWVKNLTVERVVRVMNEQTDMVFVKKDEDEGTALHDLRMENWRRLDEGEPQLGPEDDDSSLRRMSPMLLRRTRPVDEEVERLARGKIGGARMQIGGWDGRGLITATEEQIETALSAWRVFAITRDVREAAQRRLEQLLRLEIHRAKRDPRHVALRGMKNRHRAFSVYTTDDVHFHYVNRSDYLDPPPESETNNPASLYHWETVKIASPVLNPANDIMQIITTVCNTMVNNFRIHREMRTLPATTQITVSHSTGFSLTEIKKLVTLVAILHRDIARLNREWRSSTQYDYTCGPLSYISNLGGLSYTNPQVANFDADNILPHPSNEERDRLFNVMDEHIPAAALFHDSKLCDRVFYSSIWLYSTVKDLATAITTQRSHRKTEVLAKMSGRGEYTEKVEHTPDELYMAEMKDIDLNFGVVDAERGVFEFRQMACSVDGMNITAWLSICLALVHFAKSTTAAEYRRGLTDILQGNRRILDILSVPVEVQEYFRTRIQGNGYFEPDLNEPVSWNSPFFPRVPKA